MTKRTPNLGLILQTDEEDLEITAAALTDPDAQPMSDEEIARAVPFYTRFPDLRVGAGQEAAKPKDDVKS